MAGRLAIGAFRVATRRRHQSDVLAAYGTIVTISDFSRVWIERYWARSSSILFPPVDVDSFESATKRNWVLGVGRFFAGGHNKKHLELIDAFRSQTTGPLAAWELHLAGGYTPTDSSAAYLAAVQRQAAQDPRIHLHINATFDDLQGLYQVARIFWHATGLGESETAHPERFEHFGLTTVEAKAAGCVPVVLRAGGQVEIVQEGIDGILWTTVEQLVAETTSLAENEPRRLKLADAARRRARDFGLPAFEQRLSEIIGR